MRGTAGTAGAGRRPGEERELATGSAEVNIDKTAGSAVVAALAAPLHAAAVEHTCRASRSCPSTSSSCSASRLRCRRAGRQERGMARSPLCVACRPIGPPCTALPLAHCTASRTAQTKAAMACLGVHVPRLLVGFVQLPLGLCQPPLLVLERHRHRLVPPLRLGLLLGCRQGPGSRPAAGGEAAAWAHQGAASGLRL